MNGMGAKGLRNVFNVWHPTPNTPFCVSAPPPILLSAGCWHVWALRRSRLLLWVPCGPNLRPNCRSYMSLFSFFSCAACFLQFSETLAPHITCVWTAILTSTSSEPIQEKFIVKLHDMAFQASFWWMVMTWDRRNEVGGIIVALISIAPDWLMI